MQYEYFEGVQIKYFPENDKCLGWSENEEQYPSSLLRVYSLSWLATLFQKVSKDITSIQFYGYSLHLIMALHRLCRQNACGQVGGGNNICHLPWAWYWAAVVARYGKQLWRDKAASGVIAANKLGQRQHLLRQTSKQQVMVECKFER